ncbi:MAG: hypothetical protein CVV51_02155 [Spirochaetae bacterium HGW-Spirochaetae-7]|jgi:hypothetical protein|nr:MAG: hypothetical protein CVV51_02155 [Spirochaetae bacterium HGW-Spirochaetae-7]
MPYCSRCGIEVDEAADTCPLCAAPIQKLDGASPPPGKDTYPQRIIDPEDTYRLSKKERRRIGIELLTLAAGLSSVALFLVDLLTDARLGWSPYAVASVLLGWAVSVTPLALYGKPRTALAVIGVTVLAFMVVIDGFDGTTDWSLALGLPIAVASFVATGLTAAAMASRRIKGINLLGIAALGLAGFLVALEALIRLSRGTGMRPYWSLVAALALVPVAVFLFYLHGRVLRGADLRKIFRL